MKFEEQFPELKNKGATPSIKIILKEYCLSKQRVKEAMNKLKPRGLMYYEAESYDEALSDILKELGLEEEKWFT